MTLYKCVIVNIKIQNIQSETHHENEVVNKYYSWTSGITKDKCARSLLGKDASAKRNVRLDSYVSFFISLFCRLCLSLLH